MDLVPFKLRFNSLLSMVVCLSFCDSITLLCKWLCTVTDYWSVDRWDTNLQSRYHVQSPEPTLLDCQFDIMENTFFIFKLSVCISNCIYHNSIILCFVLSYSCVSNSALFLPSNTVLSFTFDVVLTLST